MLNGLASNRLQLTDEEAFALLSHCMLSEAPLDEVSERAIRKLADFCRTHGKGDSNHRGPVSKELDEAG